MEKLGTINKQTTGNVSSPKKTPNGLNNGYCEKHGEFNRMRELFSGKLVEQDCPVCMDKQIKEAEERRREAERSDRIRRLHDSSGVPKRFVSSFLDSFRETNARQETAKRKIRGYITNFKDRIERGTGVFLCGSPGTGKTMLGCIMVNEAIKQEYPAKYTTAWGMIQKIRRAYKTNESVSMHVKKFIAPALLVIDEIGVQSGSDDERILLYQVIDGRYSEVKPTVLISNSKNPVSDGYLDLRTIDRLKDGGGFSIVFDDKSQRK